MELFEALNYLYLLAFSLTGKESSSLSLLQNSLAFSSQFEPLLQQKAPIILNHHELQDLEIFMLDYYQRGQKPSGEKKKQVVTSSSFFNISAKSRFYLTKFSHDSKELMISLKDEYIEPILEFGTRLELNSFRPIEREQTTCVITRSALIRLLQTKEALSFREHTSECQSCFAFEKQFQIDMQKLLSKIEKPSQKLTQEQMEDLLFNFRNPNNDYALLGLHKLKQMSRRIASIF